MENFMFYMVWLGFIAAIVLAWYFYLKARNKERMALIESGKDVSEIFSKQEIKIKIPWLKIGLLITGIGFGLSIILILMTFPAIQSRIHGFNADAFFIASMILFGGLGIILGYYLDKSKK